MNFKSNVLLKNVTIALMAIFLIHCGGSEDKTESVDPTFTNVYNNILNVNCKSCHQPGGDVYDTDGVLLDFSSAGNAYNTLTTLSATGPISGAACNTVRIVTASSALNSFLVGILDSTYHKNNFAGAAGCSPYSSHLSDQNLTSSEKSLILNWINAGAANN